MHGIATVHTCNADSELPCVNRVTHMSQLAQPIYHEAQFLLKLLRSMRMLHRNWAFMRPAPASHGPEAHVGAMIAALPTYKTDTQKPKGLWRS